MKKASLICALAAIAMSSAPASAAVTLNTGAGGLLLGATGVVIGKDTYNVDFLTGSCTKVYKNCTTSGFDFKNSKDAQAAADALFKQVLTGKYYSYQAGNINGCSSYICDIMIPYSVYDQFDIETKLAANRGSNQFTGTIYIGPDYQFSKYDAMTFAKFTLQTASAVPEPASWAMMILGMSTIGFVMRRRSSRTAMRIRFA